MLAMELLVYDGTVKLSRGSAADQSRQSARGLQLARQQDEIALEATKAVTLLREEGTAVAFPEAVEMMRDDMRQAGKRLERTDVGEITQAIERDIIDALEEMIDALQKEMEKSKKKDQQQQQQQDGQQQDQELVDKLAELKMLRTLQLRINNRTRRLGREVEGEQAEAAEVVDQLQELAERQARVQKATYDISTGRNK
jgi:ClpP class serine protease